MWLTSGELGLSSSLHDLAKSLPNVQTKKWVITLKFDLDFILLFQGWRLHIVNLFDPCWPHRFAGQDTPSSRERKEQLRTIGKKNLQSRPQGLSRSS